MNLRLFSIRSHRYAWSSPHRYLLPLHLPHVLFSRHSGASARFMTSPLKSNCASLSDNWFCNIPEQLFLSTSQQQLGTSGTTVPMGAGLCFLSWVGTAVAHIPPYPRPNPLLCTSPSEMQCLKWHVKKSISMDSYTEVKGGVEVLNRKSCVQFFY